MSSKPVSNSKCVKTELVLPNDTNMLNNLRGGTLLHWMDIAAAISAQRHTNRVCVTAAVNNVHFGEPISLGDLITLEAQVSRAFNSSLEIFVDVFIEDPMGKKRKSNEAIFTFVAVDQRGHPIGVPPVHPESPLEKERFEGALRRKQLSLVLAGKMKPDDATELKALFT